jgi:cytochrome P450
LQAQLLQEPAVLAPAIEEILRIDAPLLTSRRLATADVGLEGVTLPARSRVTLMWASANRDEQVFGNPDEFRIDRDPALNLLYGAGIHVCPGAPLARMELKCFVEEFLRAIPGIEPAPGKPPLRALYPAGGYSSVWVRRQSVGRPA